MKVGDLVILHGRKEGRIVRGSAHGKPPARGGHWVFLFFPDDPSNRVVLCRPSELRPRGAFRERPAELQERKTVKPRVSRKKRSNYKVTVLQDGVPAGTPSRRQRQLAREGWRPSWRPA